jgi:hypothetical protein
MMKRNRRRIVILTVVFLLGVTAFAFTYRAMAERANARSIGGLAGY